MRKPRLDDVLDTLLAIAVAAGVTLGAAFILAITRLIWNVGTAAGC